MHERPEPFHEGDVAAATGGIEPVPATNASTCATSAPQRSDAAPDAVLRLLEAVIFAAERPVPTARLRTVLPEESDLTALLARLAAKHAGGAFMLVEVAEGWAFRTAPDLAPALTRIVQQPRRLTKAAFETLAIIAWHQPVTRTDIEGLRGAAVSQPVLDQLLELQLVTPSGHREAPGRPALWVTTPRFLEQFGLPSLKALPHKDEFAPQLALGTGA